MLIILTSAIYERLYIGVSSSIFLKHVRNESVPTLKATDDSGKPITLVPQKTVINYIYQVFITDE